MVFLYGLCRISCHFDVTLWEQEVLAVLFSVYALQRDSIVFHFMIASYVISLAIDQIYQT